MICLEELKDMVMYKKHFILPISNQDRRKNSLIYLISPNMMSSLNLMNLPYADKKQTFTGFYTEKNANYYINHEGKLTPIEDDSVYLNEVSEDELDAMEESLNG